MDLEHLFQFGNPETDARLSSISQYHELKSHGNLEFPVAVYPVSLAETDMNIVRWHWHTEIELLYVQSGTLWVMTDNISTVLHKGEGLFINQNVLHSMHDNKAKNAKFVSIVFHPSFLFGYGRTLLSVNYLNPLLESKTLHYKTLLPSSGNDTVILNQLHQITAAFLNQPNGYELLCKSLLCNIWYLLLQSVATVDAPVPETDKRIMNDESRIKDAIIYIEEHFASSITLDEIADSIHISKSECCRCFKRILHISPIEYLLKYRIYSATKLIQSQDPCASTISTLATSVGFSNISYFNKVFKGYLYSTPTEYKKKCQSPQKRSDAENDMTLYRNHEFMYDTSSKISEWIQ